MRIYDIKDEGTYAVWKATKTTGQYDLKTFEVRARPLQKIDGLKPNVTDSKRIDFIIPLHCHKIREGIIVYEN